MRFVITMAVLLALVADSQAGPLRRLFGGRGCSQQSYSSSSFQSSQSSSFQNSGSGFQSSGFQDSSFQQTQMVSTGVPQGVAVQGVAVQGVAQQGGAVEALEEVNRHRTARGLRPLIPDPGLNQGALAVAAHRAANFITGHSRNDFGFLPPGASASAAGCGAWSMGTVAGGGTWGTCCTYENYTYGGAAWAMGADGKRYMHLFVR